MQWFNQLDWRWWVTPSIAVKVYPGDWHISVTFGPWQFGVGSPPYGEVYD